MQTEVNKGYCMTNYYIEKNGKIINFNTDKQLLINTYGNTETILETERPIVLSDDCTEFVFADTEEYRAEQLTKAKESKTQEATDKAYSFEEKDALITVSATNFKTRASGTYHIEGNLTNNIKMSAYAQALGDTDVVPWNTKENVNILLNKTACETLTSLMSQLNAKLWTVDFPTYLAQIDTCETADEVNAINIEYQNPQEVVDINIAPADEGTEDNSAETPSGAEDSQDNGGINEDTAVE